MPKTLVIDVAIKNSKTSNVYNKIQAKICSVILQNYENIINNLIIMIIDFKKNIYFLLIFGNFEFI